MTEAAGGTMTKDGMLRRTPGAAALPPCHAAGARAQNRSA